MQIYLPWPLLCSPHLNYGPLHITLGTYFCHQRAKHLFLVFIYSNNVLVDSLCPSGLCPQWKICQNLPSSMTHYYLIPYFCAASEPSSSQAGRHQTVTWCYVWYCTMLSIQKAHMKKRTEFPHYALTTAHNTSTAVAHHLVWCIS